MTESGVATEAKEDNELVVNEMLGEGRCSVVYSGELVSPSRSRRAVAVKCWREGINFEGALQRELYVLNSISQENIVKFLGILPHFMASKRCIVLELLSFELRDLVAMNAPLAKPIIHRVALNVLSALETLHARHIGHGDLKPSNIMWSDSSKCFKLIDFGLAFNEHEPSLHCIQSPLYAAPEAVKWNEYKKSQIDKDEPPRPGVKTDIYAMGCVLYECKTGHKYKGKSDAVEYKDDENSNDLIDLIQKMTTFDPRERIAASLAMQHHFVKQEGIILNEEDLNM